MPTFSDTFSYDPDALAALGYSLELVNQSRGPLADYTGEDLVRVITDIFALAGAAGAVTSPDGVHLGVRAVGECAVQLQLTTRFTREPRARQRAYGLISPPLDTDELLHELEDAAAEQATDELVRRLVNAASDWVAGLPTRVCIDAGLVDGDDVPTGMALYEDAREPVLLGPTQLAARADDFGVVVNAPEVR
jgi:hypothetical protein